MIFMAAVSAILLLGCGIVVNAECVHDWEVWQCSSSDFNWEETHYTEYECKLCGTHKKETGQKHNWKLIEKAASGNHKHLVKCKDCGYEPYQDCDPVKVPSKTKRLKGTEGNTYHIEYSVCKTCKVFYNKLKNPHKFKKNVCVDCKFRRYIPEKIKKATLTQVGKLKKGTYTTGGYWAKYGFDWKWVPERKGTHYKATVKLSLKPGKYTVGYNIASSKSEVSNKIMLKKNTDTFAKNFTYKPYKWTYYITPISKTGNMGKTIKKTVRLR